MKFPNLFIALISLLLLCTSVQSFAESPAPSVTVQGCVQSDFDCAETIEEFGDGQTIISLQSDFQSGDVQAVSRVNAGVGGGLEPAMSAEVLVVSSPPSSRDAFGSAHIVWPYIVRSSLLTNALVDVNYNVAILGKGQVGIGKNPGINTRFKCRHTVGGGQECWNGFAWAATSGTFERSGTLRLSVPTNEYFHLNLVVSASAISPFGPAGQQSFEQSSLVAVDPFLSISPDNQNPEQFTLFTVRGLTDLSEVPPVQGSALIPPSDIVDSDGDGVPDDQDICAGGDDNIDTDGDLSPDFCDACPIDPQNDVDGDGVCGDIDICPLDHDNDADGDGVCGDIDICPLDSANDADGDGVCGDTDICPLDPDNDADGDGVCGDIDVCPLVPDNQADLDGDLVGDACDADIDGDTVLNDADNCVFDMNLDQADMDGDGAGDLCDSDDDNDNVADFLDACPMTVPGEVVNDGGCSINDLCSCDIHWKNHGAYVRCVAHTSEDFVAAGFITEVEKDTIVSIAGMSSCGAKK